MNSSLGTQLGGWLLSLTLCPSLAQAQDVATQAPKPTAATTFVELGVAVQPGQRLVLTTMDGDTVRGRFQGLELDASRLLMRTGDGTRTFSESDVREIRQRSDRLWNGALIGLGAGALGGIVFGSSRPGCEYEASFCGGVGFLAGAPLGALVGLTVDALMPHDDVLYVHRPLESSRWMLEPLVGTRGLGMSLTKAF